jgi:hypothetical protein
LRAAEVASHGSPDAIADGRKGAITGLTVEEPRISRMLRVRVIFADAQNAKEGSPRVRVAANHIEQVWCAFGGPPNTFMQVRAFGVVSQPEKVLHRIRGSRAQTDQEVVPRVPLSPSGDVVSALSGGHWWTRKGHGVKVVDISPKNWDG